MTHQLTVELPEDVYRPLSAHAQATGQTVKAVAAACLAESVRQDKPGSRLRRWVGAWASGVSDASVRHNDYLGQAILAEQSEHRDD
jgi:hypothetical protein